MSDCPITFCIGCCNNLNYLQLAAYSVRTFSYFDNAPLIIFAENCTDGTDEWLKENEKLFNLTYVIEHNSEEKTKGIGGGMNIPASMVQTEYIMFLHADMFVSKNWDLEALKIFKKYPNQKLWVSSQRFQPNCFKEQNRPGTLFFDYEEFGYKYDDFQEDYFIEYAEEFSRLNPDIEVEKGEGVSGLIKKSDWDFIGGNDPIYAPAYWEDTDLFIRMQLAGFKFVMTSNSIVFHFGSRSDKSNFPTDEIVRSERSKVYERKGAEAFLKKWGFMPAHTQQQFVTYPLTIDKSKYQNLIRLQNEKIIGTGEKLQNG
jgi:O-antigen biosynthesis protein